MERFCRWAKIYHFFFGTFFPALRALESPIATACFLLVTFLPLLPLRNLPSFLAFISVSTLFPVDFEYLRFNDFLAEDFFVVMEPSCACDDKRRHLVAWSLSTSPDAIRHEAHNRDIIGCHIAPSQLCCSIRTAPKTAIRGDHPSRL
jgi:hypothetical protein